MKVYQKINSLFKRDMSLPKSPIIIGEYSCPEFKYLESNLWLFDEKIDGTNTKIFFDGYDLTFGGKTDNAQMPVKLLKYLQDKFLPQIDVFKKVFKDVHGEEIENYATGQVEFTKSVYLYGEGYGGKIQSGSKYNEHESFILFDINIFGWWLNREDVKNIAQQLKIEVVPEVGCGTLVEMVKIVKSGFKSHFGEFKAEGIVARPMVPLRTRRGDRVIAKLKYKDFYEGKNRN